MYRALHCHSRPSFPKVLLVSTSLNIFDEVSNSRPLAVPAMPEDSPSPRGSKHHCGLDPDEDLSEVEIVNSPPKSTDKVLLGPVCSLISLYLLKIFIFLIARKTLPDY